MNRSLQLSLPLLFLTLLVGCAGTTTQTVTKETPVQTTRWVTGDFHTHTFLTDGSKTEADVVQHAFTQYGLDWMANSEHGGIYSRDPYGATIAPTPRWISLKDMSFPIVQSLRAQYPSHLLIQGLEWNNPTHEHTSVGIVGSEPTAISDFEYLFDSADYDTSRVGYVKKNVTHADAIAALTWLEQGYPTSSYAILNHPSRSLKVTAADIREFNDAAPDVCFGMEGFPGHQKELARGAYSNGPFVDGEGNDVTYKARTYGGADYMTAKIGGVWDSLLGEGRRFWIFNNSDFHVDTNDFWPGEYAKSYTMVAAAKDGAYTYSQLVDGMRSGTSFSVNGDLIDGLDFVIDKGDQKLYMGQSATVSRGQTITILIRFRSPAKNNNGAPVTVDHVDLIGGDINPPAPYGTPGYTSSTNITTRVITRFTKNDWKIEDGWNVIRYTMDIQNGTYFRLRGTNLGLNVANETDADGNPLIDTLVGTNDATKAYADLWFYSNPIFVYAR